MQDSDSRKAFLSYVENVFKIAAKRHSTLKSTQQTVEASTVVPPITAQNPEKQTAPQSRTTTSQLLDLGERGEPGIRIRGVALFMDTNEERLGISFCRVDAKNRVTISPGLANLLNGSTKRTAMKKGKFKDLALTTIAGCRSRLVRTKNKTVVLIEWDKNETPFSQANRLLSVLGKAKGGGTQKPKTISVDAMVVQYDKGEVADHLGCISASKHHHIVVYEDRGQDLSHLKTPAATTHANTGTTTANSPTPKTGSQRLQEHLDATKAGPSATPTSSKGIIPSLLGQIQKAIKPETDALTRKSAALRKFLAPRTKQPQKQQKSERTRADKGQVSPPSFIPPTKQTDHAVNALLEFLAIEKATKQVNLSTCEKILQAYSRENEDLLKVRLEEADAAIYNNDTSHIIKGTMSGEYMAAYNSTSGFVTVDNTLTTRAGKPRFITPQQDPIVVTAGCTKIMLQDKILEMAKTIIGPHSPAELSKLRAVPNIRWINGVPGCGKTKYIIDNFNPDNDIIITTTTETAKDLRNKIAYLTTSEVKFKVRTMASVLANGFSERREKRLLVDEAHMNHFGAIVMAAWLLEAEDVVIVGDVNQLPYIDRENLFDIRYSSPETLATINQELSCTHRNPMDVAFSLSEVYPDMYSSKTQIRSLELRHYTDAHIPPDTHDTLYLVLTQEEKSKLISQGYGTGANSNILTVHEAQGLTHKNVIIVRTAKRATKLRSSIPHAVVAISRHTESCIYYTDDSADAIGRFVRRAAEASDYKIRERNLKLAIKYRNEEVVKQMTTPSCHTASATASIKYL